MGDRLTAIAMVLLICGVLVGGFTAILVAVDRTLRPRLDRWLWRLAGGRGPAPAQDGDDD